MRAKAIAGAALLCAIVVGVSGRADARALDGCRPLRAIFYAATESLTLAQALAADPSPCAQYYVSVPPLAGDKTSMRSGVAGPIRVLGANFHALAEVNVTAWQGWVTSTGGSWYEAGVEARRRMAASGFDVSAGDSWVVNEFSSGVRVGSGASRQNMRDLVHGLYDGDGGPPAKGVVFVVGIGQPTVSLDTYKARLESWLQDAGFWGDIGSYVSDFLQETYGDVREYGVAGADVPTRLGYLNAYLEHVLQLASLAPSTGDAARAYLQGSYAALANAAWAWSFGFGYTAVPFDQMEDYISAQVDAVRSYDASLGWSADRIGFAWDPSNSLNLSSSDFDTAKAAIRARLAEAIVASADPAAPGAGACTPPWCTTTVDGAAFTPAWSAFSTWTPTSAGFGTTPMTVTAGTASGPMTVAPEIGPVVTPLPVDTTVHLSSSSADGSFSTSPTGPWSPGLDVTIPAGSTSATFYMLDMQPGTPTVTATVGSTSATQIEVVTAPAAPLALGGGGNVVTYAEGGGGAAVAADPALTVTDPQSPNLVSATVAISTGADAGDLLAAMTTGTGISASYVNGMLTLSGTATLAAYQSVLQSVVFSGTTTAGGTRTIVWTASDGISTASAVSTIVYTAPPSAPVGVAASAGDGQATVSFSAPASNGGAQVSSYTVTTSPGEQTATGFGSPITVTGLADGTTYTFTVTATNPAGTGPASAPSNPVTPAAPGGGGSGGGGAGGGSGTPTAPASASAPAPVPAAPPPAAVGNSAASAAVGVTVYGVHRVVLGGRRPSLAFSVRVSRATTLVVRLRRDSHGRVLATWRRLVPRGTRRLSLVLPAKARHAGSDLLRLSWPGGRSKSLAVTVRARI